VRRIILAFLALSMPAAAAERPRLQPTRDVQVVYRVRGEAAHQKNVPAVSALDVSFSARDGGRLRVQPAGQHVWLLMDRGSRQLTLVMADTHSFLELPYDISLPLRLDETGDATFTLTGHAVVAGLRCTEYDVQSRQVHGTACLTADGVLLRAAGASSGLHGGGELEATEVHFAPLPARLFAPPADFAPLPIPRLPLTTSGKSKN
jgi:hypothetical protein